MYILGHASLGFLAARLVNKFTGYRVNVPLVMIVSMLPDFDLLIPSLPHRGPTHSIILITVFCLPLIALNRSSLVYYASLLSHPLIGDYFTSYGCTIFWPLSSHHFRVPAYLHIPLSIQTTIEAILFVVAAMIIFYDYSRNAVEISQKSPILEV